MGDPDQMPRIDTYVMGEGSISKPFLGKMHGIAGL
jgi:hypothetical protein